MALPKGHKKVGGRQKGTPNKRTKLVEETAARLGVDPFEVLCLFAMGNWEKLGYEAEMFFMEKPDGAVKAGYVITPEMRLKAAQEACKYLFSQKKAVEHSTSDEGFRMIIQDYTKYDKKES